MTNQITSNLKNDSLIKALLRQPVDRTPIWIMRQAGRYLPEYRQLRQQVGSFMGLCQNPELACQVTLQPLARFDLDAAILFSDILTIPDAMGLGLYFVEGEGPRFKNPLRSANAISQLAVPDPEQDLKYVVDAVRLIKKELDHKLPLIGFAGSPWTLACYMVEGGPSKTFSLIKGMIYQDPKALHQLLEILARSVTDYLNAQIKAGVDVVMLFDTWGGVLSHGDYPDFSLNYMKQILDGLIKERDGVPIPTILFTKNGGQWLEKIAESGCDCIGLDWTTDIGLARERVGDRVALQGNLDPCVLYGSPERIRAEAIKILKASDESDSGKGNGHVFNLGHGIYPDVPIESLQVLIEMVHKYDL